MSASQPLSKVFVALRPVNDQPLHSLQTSSRRTANVTDVSGLGTITMFALSHWVVLVLPESSSAGFGRFQTFELLNPSDTDGVILSARRRTTWDSTTLAGCQGKIIGLTARSYEEISAIGEELIQKWGKYDLLTNNCQAFAIRLINTICVEHCYGWLLVAAPKFQTRFAFFIGRHPSKDEATGTDGIPAEYAAAVRPCMNEYDPDSTVKYMFGSDSSRTRPKGFLS
ncbi:hypothetical protein C8R47DRAFT_1324177, partial [Mycena vitilis]